MITAYCVSDALVLLRSVLVVGTSKKKAKHNAAESLLGLVEGVDIESTTDEAQYAVICVLQSVTVVVLFM